ncbi:MAG: ferritin [Treponema sp.]|nr:ferritin [Treponema sp.]
MAITKEMQDAINDQINAELYSAYLYLSMGAYFADEGLTGFENWMRCQYMEETMHAMKMFNYVIERGGRVELKAIDQPAKTWNSYVEVMEEVLKHEQYVTSRINKLVSLSRKLEDYASESFLMWFIDEQVEEEASAEELLIKLKRVKDSPNALYQFDSQLATRVLAPDVVPVIMNQAVN